MFWDDVGSEQVGKSRRADYESIKAVLIDLYTKWNKPEIAEYFKVVPYCQLRHENQRLFGGEVEEFPTISEFRHDMWTVRGNPKDPYYILDINGVGTKLTMRGSSLFKQLVTVVGDTHDERKSIFPIDGKFVDDEDFASNKTCKES
ncbi:MAG: hypothetical protein SGJ27_14290 [Candidatus Melainabacteria bacterium]|nr:hypothetical protein [Candidatus Melainabacteria bacterium]